MSAFCADVGNESGYKLWCDHRLHLLNPHAYMYYLWVEHCVYYYMYSNTMLHAHCVTVYMYSNMNVCTKLIFAVMHVRQWIIAHAWSQDSTIIILLIIIVCNKDIVQIALGHDNGFPHTPCNTLTTQRQYHDIKAHVTHCLSIRWSSMWLLIKLATV